MCAQFVLIEQAAT